jgi:hypothetical protein
MAQAFLQNYKFVRAAGLGLSLSLVVLCARADTFSRVSFDAATDQLVVTMRYRGTNADHVFTLRWGQCGQPQGGALPEVVAEVLDSQALDAASKDFKTTTRFDLANLPCRPAKVTLRTAPHFYTTLVIPAARAPHP